MGIFQLAPQGCVLPANTGDKVYASVTCWKLPPPWLCETLLLVIFLCNDLWQPAPFPNEPWSVAVGRDGVTVDMNSTSSPDENIMFLALSCVSNLGYQGPRQTLAMGTWE